MGTDVRTKWTATNTADRRPLELLGTHDGNDEVHKKGEGDTGHEERFHRMMRVGVDRSAAGAAATQRSFSQPEA
jgi:hypothetical protein